MGSWTKLGEAGALADSPAFQFADYVLDDAGDLVGVDGFAHGATTEGFIHKTFGGEEALDLVAEFYQALLLGGGLGLAAATGAEAAEGDARAKTFREFGGVEHRVEEGEQAVLEGAGFV